MSKIEANQQQVDDGISPLRETGKDLLWYILANVLPAVVSLLGISVYTRLLSPKEYGLYILIYASICMADTLLFGWIYSTSLRYFEECRAKNNLSQYFSTMFALFLSSFLVGSVLGGILIFLFKHFLNHYWISLLGLGILTLLTRVLYSFVIVLIRAERITTKYGLYAAINSFGGTLIALALIYFFHMKAAGILLGISISSGGIALIELMQFKKRWNLHFSFISGKMLREFTNYGIPLIAVAGSSQALSSLDRFLLQWFVGLSEVGIYSAGYSIANGFVGMPSSILYPVTYPVIIQTYERREETDTRQFLRQIFSIYFIIMFPVLIGILACAKLLVRFVAGSSFTKASIIMPWIGIAVFLSGISYLFLIPFQLKKRTQTMLYIRVATLFINILLNLLFIPLVGILGAAYAFLGSCLASLALSYFFSSRIFVWLFPWSSFLKTLLASSGMLIFLVLSMRFLKINLLALICGGTVSFIFYVLILFLLQEENVLNFKNKGIRSLKNKYKNCRISIGAPLS